MKARHIVWALVLTLAAGTAQADFILTGNQHLDVTRYYGWGILYNFSTADVLAGGYVSSLSTWDSSIVNRSGGRVDLLYAYGSSIMNISGAGEGGELYAYDTSTVNLSSGAVNRIQAWDSSIVNISGGYVGLLYGTHGSNTMNISGGYVDTILAYSAITVNVSGGSISHLQAWNSSTTVLHGYDFQATDGLSLIGDTVLGTGLLTGKWFDGTPWAMNILTHEATATILAVDVPEPATLALLCLGGLALLRRRKA
jgi:hypothetical protein